LHIGFPLAGLTWDWIATSLQSNPKVSPKFAVKVGIWIEEWKKYSDKNLLDYYDALSDLEPFNHNNKKKLIQKKLHKKYGGQIEVTTQVGDIDLLTDDLLIEIKTYDNWKCALGQLIAYSTFYPNRDKCMYLFDIGDKDVKIIKKICNKENIKFMTDYFLI
jgi:hypothetical protein